MAEMTLDQQRAVAVASARLRLQNSAGTASPAPAPQPPPSGQSGATGSWEPPSVFDRLMNSGPVKTLANFGKSFADQGEAMASGLYHAATDAPTAKDQVDGYNLPIVPLIVKRLLVDPQMQQYQQAKTAQASGDTLSMVGHSIAAAIPVIGPAAASVGERLGKGDISGALGEGAFDVLVPKVMEEVPVVAPAVDAIVDKVKSLPDWAVDKFKPKPVITMLRAIGTSDPTARTWIPKLMDELKASGDVKTVDDARAAIQTRMNDVYNPLVEKILEPQNDVVIPDSRAEHVQARIDAIPDRIRLDNPDKYAGMVKDVQDSIGKGPDYTIGDLNSLRKSYERSVKHNQSISASMAADESTAAMDRASMRFALDKFYGSLDQVSGTGTDVVQELNSRIGAMIKGEEALSKRTNRAAIQSGQSAPAQFVEGVGHVMRSGKYAENLGSGVTSMINSDLASAMRRWQRTPSEIVPGPTADLASQIRRPTLPTTAFPQNRTVFDHLKSGSGPSAIDKPANIDFIPKSDAFDTKSLGPRWHSSEDLGSMDENAEHWLDGTDAETAKAGLSRTTHGEWTVETHDGRSMGPFPTVQQAVRAAESAYPQANVTPKLQRPSGKFLR